MYLLLNLQVMIILMIIKHIKILYICKKIKIHILIFVKKYRKIKRAEIPSCFANTDFNFILFSHVITFQNL